MDEIETLSETNELDSLEDNFYNLPDVEPTSIAASEHEMVPQPVEGKETSEVPSHTEHQLEQSTTRELVLQELAKSGRGEGFEIKEEQGQFRLSEDGNEMFNEKGESYTKMVEESGDQEAIAIHYEMLQQFRDGGGAIFINKEQPGDEDPDTMHGSYMMRNEDGSISWGLTERKIERSEEEEITGREEDGAPVENRWTTFEHTGYEAVQPDGLVEVLGQFAAAQEAHVSHPDTVELGNSEERSEQTAVVAIETIASPTVDSTETTTNDVVETGGVLIETAHELSETESVSTSEFLPVDSLESLPVFETPEVTAHAPEAVVLDATFSQAPQIPDICETAMYQAIIAFLKNDADAINLSEKSDGETGAESTQETAIFSPMPESGEETVERAEALPIESSTDSAFPETQSQPIETAQGTEGAATTTAQISSAETVGTVSRVEEKIDGVPVLRETGPKARTTPETTQEKPDRKVDEAESIGLRSEEPERQTVPDAHEILLKTLGIREKTVAIHEQRPYNEILRAGNPMIQLPNRTSSQPRGRTLSNRGISLIEV